MSSDYLYFKFRPINKHLVESLVSPSLYFAKPDTLNDPFDCRLDLRSSFTRATLSATGRRKEWLRGTLDDRTFFKTCERKLPNVGVCSFSLDSNSALLWSHYADDHKGVCLLYRFPESFILDPTNQIIGADKVKYTSDALTKWLKNAPMNSSSLDREIELIKIYLTTKSPSWRYEKEARIIRCEHGLLNISGKYLAQVCFGLQTPQADIGLVSTLAREYCGCTQFCRMVRDESDFGFSMKEI
jgi:hypothetical protein